MIEAKSIFQNLLIRTKKTILNKVNLNTIQKNQN